MRKFLSFLMIAFFATSMVSAQTVYFVDDDQNTAEADPIVTALDNWGGVYTYRSTATEGIPTFADISSFDIVIWYTGNDGLDLRLWDVSDTTSVGAGAVKFNDALAQYYNAGGVIWIDGLDFLYDIYDVAPATFSAGDFVYDVLGLTGYLSQSHVDEPDGVAQMDISSTNTLTTTDPIKWVFSTLWNADGLAIRDDAVALYEMGPAGYALEGQVTALYRNNVITSSLRLAKISPQADLDQIISDMLTAVNGGSFPAAVQNVNNNTVKLYPNPAVNNITVELGNAQNAQIAVYDLTGRKILTQAVSGQNNVSINVANLTPGFYTMTVNDGQKISSSKFSIVK